MKIGDIVTIPGPVYPTDDPAVGIVTGERPSTNPDSDYVTVYWADTAQHEAWLRTQLKVIHACG